jgi:murein DD-endopeptidase MepM/ murein hydrolase activator NlpD
MPSRAALVVTLLALVGATLLLGRGAFAGEDDVLAGRDLLFPVPGAARSALRDNFDEGRGNRKHEALDIMAPRGTAVVAVDSGRVAKLFTSAAGGITLYQFDRDEKYAYYYAHLDRYASGIAEGKWLQRGEVLGYVGSSGNAKPDAPHLHFTIFRLGPDKKWWKGTAVNPYRFLAHREGHEVPARKAKQSDKENKR